MKSGTLVRITFKYSKPHEIIGIFLKRDIDPMFSHVYVLNANYQFNRLQYLLTDYLEIIS